MTETIEQKAAQAAGIPPRRRKWVAVGISMTQDIVDRVEEVCKAIGCTRSALYREGVERVLNDYERALRKAKREAKQEAGNAD